MFQLLITDDAQNIRERLAEFMRGRCLQGDPDFSAQGVQSHMQALQGYLRAALCGSTIPPAPAGEQLQCAGVRYGCALCTGFSGRENLLNKLLYRQLRGSGMHTGILYLGAPPVLALVHWGVQSAESSFSTMRRALTSIALSCRRDFHLDVHFFVGDTVERADRLSTAWQQCTSARNYSFLEQAPPVVRYADILAARLEPAPSMPPAIVSTLFAAVACKSRIDYTIAADMLFAWFGEKHIYDAEFIRMCILFLCHRILTVRVGDTLPSYYELIDFQAEIMSAQSPSELRTLLDQLVLRQWNLRQKQPTPEPSLAFRVEEIVKQHLSDTEFSLNDVAAVLFISPNYLRQLYKEETGHTFTEYLTACRMEHSRLLLGNPALKIAEVAEQVGYADTRYFSVCFKKYFHRTPSEYRMDVKIDR